MTINPPRTDPLRLPNAKTLLERTSDAIPEAVLRARDAVLRAVPSVRTSVHSGSYVDYAVLDLYPARVTLETLAFVYPLLVTALLGSDWVIERVEWTYQSGIVVDGIWLIRNAAPFGDSHGER